MNNENLGQNPETLALASEIVAAYVANNSLPVSELPRLIGSVQAALSALRNSAGVAGTNTMAEKVDLLTAAHIRKSIRADGLISFIDGKTYQTLKRHLTKHGLDPHSYRKRFGLPADYPMTAASYSEKRSALARELGLGRSGRAAA